MSNTKKYSMNMADANNTLQSIFDACNVSHNTIPFDKIMLRSMAETKLVRHAKNVAILFCALVIICPLSFRRDTGFTVLNRSIGQPIIVADHQLYQNSFAMMLDGQGIIYNDIKAIEENGAIVYPTSIDENKGLVIFPYDGNAFSISVPNTGGYVLNAIVAERK